jgi:hypothetical protein
MTLPIVERLRQSARARSYVPEDMVEWQAADTIEQLCVAVQYAADVFDDYARQHQAKGTEEGVAKAERNRLRRDKMRAVTAKARDEA